LVINNAGGSLFEVSKFGSTDLFLEVQTTGNALTASDFVLA
jgi:hypothetical protein